MHPAAVVGKITSLSAENFLLQCLDHNNTCRKVPGMFVSTHVILHECADCAPSNSLSSEDQWMNSASVASHKFLKELFSGGRGGCGVRTCSPKLQEVFWKKPPCTSVTDCICDGSRVVVFEPGLGLGHQVASSASSPVSPCQSMSRT